MITGAGTGLNKGAAIELARRGFDVIACVENYPQLRATENYQKLQDEVRHRKMAPEAQSCDRIF